MWTGRINSRGRRFESCGKRWFRTQTYTSTARRALEKRARWSGCWIAIRRHGSADPFRKGNNYSFIDKSADTEALDYYYGLVEAAKAEAFDLTVRYETFAKAEAFLIDHAYVIPFGFGNGGYVASRIDPFTSQFAPYGFTNERYKGSEILSEPMDTDAYFDAYDQWIEDRASQTK